LNWLQTQIFANGDFRGECCIKLCKNYGDFELRLIPGDWLQVVGEKKLDKKTGLLKLAERVVPAATSYTETALPVKATPVKSDQYFGVSKSDCMKRGGKRSVRAIDAALSAHLRRQSCNHWNWLHENCKAGQT